MAYKNIVFPWIKMKAFDVLKQLFVQCVLQPKITL